MYLLLWILALLVPFFIGKVLNTKGEMSCFDDYVTGIMVIIGITEVVHLAGLVLGWSFLRCSTLLVVVLLASSGGSGIYYAVKRRSSSKRGSKGIGSPLFFGFVLLVLLQVVLLVTSPRIYRVGDMMPETVNSFILSDSIYQINPLTGENGAAIPLRLKILSLPTLYGMLVQASGLDVEGVLYRIIPSIVLICSYCVYIGLGRTLFRNNPKKRGIFLVVVALLLFLGNYGETMDGFMIFHSGYRGSTIRSMVLIPYTISMYLQKKWKSVLLCILAEACIVWTFYGLGACVLITVFMTIVSILRKRTGE